MISCHASPRCVPRCWERERDRDSDRHSWPTVVALPRDELRLAATPRRVPHARARARSLVDVGVSTFTGTGGANWPQLRLELPCINSRAVASECLCKMIMRVLSGDSVD